MASVIPFGQPILVGHHSERRDRSYRDRIRSTEDRAVDALTDGQDAGHRARAARANQAHRMNGATTERRITKLEAELRSAQRAGRDVLAAELEEQLSYWRGHLNQLVADGMYRKWGPGDFVRGDLVRVRSRWYEVKRVNPKSLTVRSPLGSWTDTVPYDTVDGHRPKADGDPEGEPVVR